MPAWHWAILGVSIALSAILTQAVRLFVRNSRLGLSSPRERDVHTSPIPRLGGVALGGTFLLVCILLYLIAPEKLHFINATIWGVDRNLFGILCGVLLLLIVGVYDDIYGLNPFIKLLFHFAAGIMLALSTVLVTHITNPFGGIIQLGAWTGLFVVLWVVSLINVINFLDGLDGLASGITLIATVVLYLLAIKPDVSQYSMSVLALILAGAMIGFLPFNFYPAKIFMGDSGSQTLGFLLAVFAIISGGKLATAFLVLGVPILDVIWVVTRRLITHQPVYQADRFHLHHRLLAAGLSQKDAVILLYTFSAAFGIIALQTRTLGKLVASLVLVSIMIIGGATLVAVTSRKNKANV